MGYFSNLAAEYVPYDNDHSYTAPDRQLLWRLEELETRLHELVTQKTGNRDEGVCFSEENLRYVLPEHFLPASNVQKAIELAIDDLRDRYGIYVREEACEEEEPVEDEITGMQVTFFDILALQSQCVPLNAA